MRLIALHRGSNCPLVRMSDCRHPLAHANSCHFLIVRTRSLAVADVAEARCFVTILYLQQYINSSAVDKRNARMRLV